MKKLLLLLLCMVHAAHGTSLRVARHQAPSLPHAVAQTQKQASLQHRSMRQSAPSWREHEGAVSSTWRYWAMGLAIGGGVIFAGDGDDHHRIPFPDIRLSVEKSWYLTTRFTAAFDCSLFTPTLRFGYIVGESTRVSLGIGLWLLGLYSVYGLHRFSEYIDMLGKNIAMKAKREHALKNVLKVTPSLSLDHFLSSNCFFRLTVSYDRMLLELNKRHEIKVQWPQLTMGLNFKF